MGKMQFIDVEGAERLVVLPESEYRRLAEAAEELEDMAMAVAAEKRRAAGVADPVDGELVHAMLRASHPLAGAIAFRGMKLATLKARTGLSLSYISDLSKGRTRGSIDAWRKLADALDAPLDLLTDDSTPAQ